MAEFADDSCDNEIRGYEKQSRHDMTGRLARRRSWLTEAVPFPGFEIGRIRPRRANCAESLAK